MKGKIKGTSTNTHTRTNTHTHTHTHTHPRRYVEEREEAHKEWVFFTKQVLTVLPSARTYGLKNILLGMCKMVFNDIRLRLV